MAPPDERPRDHERLPDDERRRDVERPLADEVPRDEPTRRVLPEVVFEPKDGRLERLLRVRA